MKPTRRIAKYIALYSVAFLIVACESRMGPAAKNSIDHINATLAATSADAQKYVPDQLTAVQGKVAALTAAYDKKDYGTVMGSAPGVLADVNDLATAIAAKKDEMLKALGDQWRSLAASIPQSVTAVQTRIDALTASMCRKILMSRLPNRDSPTQPRRGRTRSPHSKRATHPMLCPWPRMP